MYLYHTTSFAAAAAIDAHGLNESLTLLGDDVATELPTALLLQDRPLNEADRESLIEGSDFNDNEDGDLDAEVDAEGFVSLLGCDVCYRITVPDGAQLALYEDGSGLDDARDVVSSGQTAPGIYRQWCIPMAIVNTWVRERIRG